MVGQSLSRTNLLEQAPHDESRHRTLTIDREVRPERESPDDGFWSKLIRMITSAISGASRSQDQPPVKGYRHIADTLIEDIRNHPYLSNTFMAWADLVQSAPSPALEAARKALENRFGAEIADVIKSGDREGIAAIRVALGDQGRAILDAAVSKPNDEIALKRLSETAIRQIMVPSNAPSQSSIGDTDLQWNLVLPSFRKEVRDINAVDADTARLILAVGNIGTIRDVVDLEETVKDLASRGLTPDALEKIRHAAEGALLAGVKASSKLSAPPITPEPAITAQRKAFSGHTV